MKTDGKILLSEEAKKPDQSEYQTVLSGIENLPKENKEEAKNQENPDINSENLLQAISKEWEQEIEILKNSKNGNELADKNLNCLVQSGHAEIEGDTMLYIYGNALEVLNNNDFQKTVQQINFQHIRFDSIVDYNNLPKLRKFTKLSKLAFSNNYLHSFAQVMSLECFPHLSSISIENNDITKATLIKDFIIYRFPLIQIINGINVSEVEKTRVKKLFQRLDKFNSSASFFSVTMLY